MPALVAGIHVFAECVTKDVDGRDKPGHDIEIYSTNPSSSALICSAR